MGDSGHSMSFTTTADTLTAETTIAEVKKAIDAGRHELAAGIRESQRATDPARAQTHADFEALIDFDFVHSQNSRRHRFAPAGLACASIRALAERKRGDGKSESARTVLVVRGCAELAASEKALFGRYPARCFSPTF